MHPRARLSSRGARGGPLDTLPLRVVELAYATSLQCLLPCEREAINMRKHEWRAEDTSPSVRPADGAADPSDQSHPRLQQLKEIIEAIHLTALLRKDEKKIGRAHV